MIILDTNVISELMRAEPNARVKAWIGRQKPLNCAITVITVAEIGFGLARLAKSKKQRDLQQRFQSFVAETFDGRIFDFDQAAAVHYGELAAQSERKGHAVDPVDIMIAAIAHKYESSIATRNIKHYAGCGLRMINPWDGSP